MEGVGVFVITAGVWLLYSAITNQGPIKTLIAILQNPANARQIVAAKENKLSQTPFGSTADSGGSASPSSDVSGTGGAAAIVAFARAQIGKPYASPGDSNTTWDCSGLTKAAVKAGTGIDLPHLVSGQMLSMKGKTVSRSDLRAGDIVSPSIGHCGVATSNTTMVDAPDWGRTVVERPIYGFITAKRFTAPAAPTTNA